MLPRPPSMWTLSLVVLVHRSGGKLQETPTWTNDKYGWFSRPSTYNINRSHLWHSLLLCADTHGQFHFYSSRHVQYKKKSPFLQTYLWQRQLINIRYRANRNICGLSVGARRHASTALKHTVRLPNGLSIKKYFVWKPNSWKWFHRFRILRLEGWHKLDSANGVSGSVWRRTSSNLSPLFHWRRQQNAFRWGCLCQN